MRLRAEPILFSLMAFPSIGIHVLHALTVEDFDKRKGETIHDVERIPYKVGHKDTTGAALMPREYFLKVQEWHRSTMHINMHLECIWIQIPDYFISYDDMVQ